MINKPKAKIHSVSLDKVFRVSFEQWQNYIRKLDKRLKSKFRSLIVSSLQIPCVPTETKALL